MRKHEGAVLIAGEKSFFEGEKSKEKLDHLLTSHIVITNNDDYFVVKP